MRSVFLFTAMTLYSVMGCEDPRALNNGNIDEACVFCDSLTSKDACDDEGICSWNNGECKFTCKHPGATNFGVVQEECKFCRDIEEQASCGGICEWDNEECKNKLRCENQPEALNNGELYEACVFCDLFDTLTDIHNALVCEQYNDIRYMNLDDTVNGKYCNLAKNEYDESICYFNGTMCVSSFRQRMCDKREECKWVGENANGGCIFSSNCHDDRALNYPSDTEVCLFCRDLEKEACVEQCSFHEEVGCQDDVTPTCGDPLASNYPGYEPFMPDFQLCTYSTCNDARNNDYYCRNNKMCHFFIDEDGARKCEDVTCNETSALNFGSARPVLPAPAGSLLLSMQELHLSTSTLNQIPALVCTYSSCSSASNNLLWCERSSNCQVKNLFHDTGFLRSICEDKPEDVIRIVDMCTTINIDKNNYDERYCLESDAACFFSRAYDENKPGRCQMRRAPATCEHTDGFTENEEDCVCGTVECTAFSGHFCYANVNQCSKDGEFRAFTDNKLLVADGCEEDAGLKTIQDKYDCTEAARVLWDFTTQEDGDIIVKNMARQHTDRDVNGGGFYLPGGCSIEDVPGRDPMFNDVAPLRNPVQGTYGLRYACAMSLKPCTGGLTPITETCSCSNKACMQGEYCVSISGEQKCLDKETFDIGYNKGLSFLTEADADQRIAGLHCGQLSSIYQQSCGC